MSAIRRLSDDDVRAIFECLHGNQRPPPGLTFQIVPVGPDGLKLSPPSHEFQDGLYVLLQPDKKRRNLGTWSPDVSKVPSNLRDLTMTDFPPRSCPWSLSGPQFPQPTAIQQRYCYPKGNHDYSSNKGGALWTMYDLNGKENLQFRLLHVYFSTKRATNKSAASDPTQRRTPTSTPRRKRRPNGSRSGYSPYSQSSCTTPRSIHTTVTESPLNLPNDVHTFNPMTLGEISRLDERSQSIFVTPSVTEHEFLGNPFHPVASFELDSFDPCPFLEPDFALMENLFEKGDSGQSVQPKSIEQVEKTDSIMADDVKDDAAAEWRDPLFTIVMKSSIDDTDDIFESLHQKLVFFRQRIEDMVSASSDKRSAVDIIVSWARGLASSSLDVPKGVENLTRMNFGASQSIKDPQQGATMTTHPRYRHFYAKMGASWSVLDDALICRLRSTQGPNWTIIAPCLPGRTAVEVKLRYHFLKKRLDKTLKSVTLTKGIVGYIQALKQSMLQESGEADVNILQHLADCVENGNYAARDGEYSFGPFRAVTTTGELCTRCSLVIPSFETGHSVCEKTGWCETCTRLSVCVSGKYLRQIHIVPNSTKSRMIKQKCV
eukprot:scaffold1900_cov123-Cylindrotheca_fusiformis.AAC.38